MDGKLYRVAGGTNAIPRRPAQHIMTAPSLTSVSFHIARQGGRLSAIGPAMRPAENSARTRLL